MAVGLLNGGISEQELRKLNIKALAELASRELAKRDLIEFSKRVYDGYEVGNHHRYVAEVLMKAVSGDKEYQKLIFHEPPQHGKSTQVSILFPALFLGMFPNKSIIITAYSDQHAASFSRKIRDIINSPQYQMIFPGIKLNPDSRAANRWELAPPYKGSMVASGLMGRITGVGADLLIIDDPYKNREEVESKIIREKIEETYRSTLKTRLHEGAIQIVVMTRWRDNDLSGYLLNKDKSFEDGWQYVCLSALAKEHGDPDLLGRRKLEPLWASHFSQAYLLWQKETLGSYNWNSMYRGRPAPSEGQMFKREFFQIVKNAPKNLVWVRYWDLAVGETDKDSYTASIRASVDPVTGNRYYADMIRFQKPWHYVRKMIKETWLREQEILGDMLIGIESQGMQKGMVQECYADPELVSVGILPIPVSNSKRIRALPVSAAGEAGKLYFVAGPWINDAIDELIVFDSGDYDDQVDAISGSTKLLFFLGGEYAAALDRYNKDGSEKEESQIDDSVNSSFVTPHDVIDDDEYDELVVAADYAEETHFFANYLTQ